MHEPAKVPAGHVADVAVAVPSWLGLVTGGGGVGAPGLPPPQAIRKTVEAINNAKRAETAKRMQGNLGLGMKNLVNARSTVKPATAVQFDA
jgi:hypothetical protein